VGNAVAVVIGLLLMASSPAAIGLSHANATATAAQAQSKSSPSLDGESVPVASQIQLLSSGSSAEAIPYSFWKGSIWSDPSSSFDNSMNVTFDAVANSLAGLSSTDWVAIEPINMAYGHDQTNYEWIQFIVRFNGSGSVNFCLEENQWANNAWDYGGPASMLTNKYVGEWCTSNLVDTISVSYTVEHTYQAQLFPTDSSHVEFVLTDDTTNKQWTQTMDISTNNVLYNYGLTQGYSPATMIEGYTDGSSNTFPSVPDLELDIINDMQHGQDFVSPVLAGVNYYTQGTEAQGNYWKWEPVVFAQSTGECATFCSLPAPLILKSSITYPSSITVGQTAKIDIPVENNGANAAWMTVQISFPRNPPMSSLSIDTQDTTVPDTQIYPSGYTISSGYGFRTGLSAPSVQTTYPIIEGSGSWASGETKHLVVYVTPTGAETGKFMFEVKSVAASVTEAITWDPMPTSTDCTVVQDQQSEYSCSYSFTVNSATTSTTSTATSSSSSSTSTFSPIVGSDVQNSGSVNVPAGGSTYLYAATECGSVNISAPSFTPDLSVTSYYNLTTIMIGHSTDDNASYNTGGAMFPNISGIGVPESSFQPLIFHNIESNNISESYALTQQSLVVLVSAASTNIEPVSLSSQFTVDINSDNLCDNIILAHAIEGAGTYTLSMNYSKWRGAGYNDNQRAIGVVLYVFPYSSTSPVPEFNTQSLIAVATVALAATAFLTRKAAARKQSNLRR
jgi:hypothetical protein